MTGDSRTLLLTAGRGHQSHPMDKRPMSSAPPNGKCAAECNCSFPNVHRFGHPTTYECLSIIHGCPWSVINASTNRSERCLPHQLSPTSQRLRSCQWPHHRRSCMFLDPASPATLVYVRGGKKRHQRPTHVGRCAEEREQRTKVFSLTHGPCLFGIFALDRPKERGGSGTVSRSSWLCRMQRLDEQKDICAVKPLQKGLFLVATCS